MRNYEFEIHPARDGGEDVILIVQPGVGLEPDNNVFIHPDQTESFINGIRALSGSIKREASRREETRED